MSPNDIAVLKLALTRLREVNGVFSELHAGVCALHLDACIAALESRILKAKAALPAADMEHT